MMDKAAASWEHERAHLQAVIQAQREDLEMLTTTNEALNTALDIKASDLLACLLTLIACLLACSL